MTNLECFKKFIADLSPEYGRDEGTAITNIIFQHFTGKTKAEMLREENRVMDLELIETLDASLQQLKERVPVQYICGETEFFKLQFKVTPAVLIPRPETEELVANALGWLRNYPRARVIDIGTGSGCIAIALKKNSSGITVTAIDKSAMALDVAKENAELNEADIEFLELDFLVKNSRDHLGMFDAIVSNPPYIPESEKSSLDENVVKYEPGSALFVPDERPLIFYEEILDFSLQHLGAGGKIFLETHELLAKEVHTLFIKAGFDAEIKTDIPGRERMVIATRFL